MDGNAQKTLFYPFETGDLALPGGDDRILFIGAEPGFTLPRDFDAPLLVVQGFRPHYRALQGRGFDVAPRAEGEGFDLGLVLLGRHRGQNELQLWEALRRTRPGGLIVAAGGKTEGAESFRKRVAAWLPIEGHIAKYHGTAFWLRRPSELPVALSPQRPTLVEGRFHAAPGMFSHDRIDPGSRFLIQHLPQDIKGAVADFCAGWGYIAACLAESRPEISALDLYEADFESIEAARRNLVGLRSDMESGFFWHDLLQEPVERRYDAVVMNPPFHQGRAADPGIGQGMVRAAAAALKPGGALYMVANRGLPYEPAVAAAFRNSGEIARDGSYKVLWARQPKR